MARRWPPSATPWRRRAPPLDRLASGDRRTLLDSERRPSDNGGSRNDLASSESDGAPTIGCRIVGTLALLSESQEAGETPLSRDGVVCSKRRSLNLWRLVRTCLSGGVRQRRRCLAADDRRGFMNEFVVLERRHHEQAKVHAAHDVTSEDGIADVPAPHGQTLTFALFEVAPAHDRLPGVAGKDPLAPFHLFVKFHDASESRETPPVTPCNCLLDNLGVIRLSFSDSDASLELVELPDAALPAYANHRVAPIKCVCTMYFRASRTPRRCKPFIM